MRVLITGGAGHFGPIVCSAFLRDGADVRVLLHRRKMKGLDTGLEIMWGDLTQPNTVERLVEGVDAVVHLAAMVQPMTEQSPELATRINVGGTQTIVDLLKERGASIPFVYISSAAVFGPTPDATECLHPDRNQCNPTSVYARTKVQAEGLIRESGIDYVILRLTSVPYPKVSMGDMKTQMFIVPLENRVEFCHPDDATLAILNSVKWFDKVKGKTLMIGGGPSQRIQYKDMVGAALGTFGLPLPPRHKFSEEPFALDWYDTSESQELLQYQHKTLDDYSRDLASQFPAPMIALMRRAVGPALGRLIVRLM
ncbi:MAG: NAD(P)-dependent oxidoreductase [Dehalococcoidia bacterium]